MAIRDVYTQDEKKMLADFDEEAKKLQGWAKSLSRPVATEDSIKNMALAIDCWNPLWSDENYAMNTRWGGIIAPPFYETRFSFKLITLHPTPNVGFPAHVYIGDDIEIFKPVHVNDSLKIWRRRPKLEDITDLDGKGPRKFKFLPIDIDHINQKDELVSTLKTHIEFTFIPELPKKLESMPEYIYTKEELKFIDRIADEEEIRGANTRYWEDVKVGEKIRPVVLGPTTIWDLVVLHTGLGAPVGTQLPIREMRKRVPGELMPEPDPVTGVTHALVEVHLSERVASMGGNPRPFHFGVQARQLMARLVTNWMGDDGFIRQFNWRHFSRTPTGDSIIGKGIVTNKYVENGDYLVDIAVWLENLRGNVTEAAVVIVSLFSKETHFKWK